jgi:hypothetical protein
MIEGDQGGNERQWSSMMVVYLPKACAQVTVPAVTLGMRGWRRYGGTSSGLTISQLAEVPIVGKAYLRTNEQLTTLSFIITSLSSVTW